MAEATATSVAIPLSQFIPLIKDVSEIFSKVTDLYKSAQHNKNIAGILLERISAANITVNILQARENLLTSTYYKSLYRLVHILQDMKIYIEEVTQYNTMQNFLKINIIEKKFKELREEYDNSFDFLKFNLSLNCNFNAKEEDIVVKEDIAESLKFQEILTESMKDVQQKVTFTNDQMNVLVERISEMSITMQTMQNLMDIKRRKKDDVSKIQTNIDNIFPTSLLQFDDYGEADEERSDKLRKYVHIKTKEEYAFKVIDQEHFDVKNQVTILMKLKDCQNIINFYGLTSNDSKTYLITEWAEKGNLREYIIAHGQNIDLKFKIRIAYDIAKGLNFLNVVKMVHRDIRAENIVITDHDIAKITNFKFIRIAEEATANLFVNKEVVRYSAPELLRKRFTGEKNDKYSDYVTKCEVYSLGVLLWEIAECKIPYDQFEDFMEITKEVLGGYREKFTPGAAIPEKYQELVNKSVDQNPGSRPLFSKILIGLHDIFKNYTSESSSSHSNSYVQKMTHSTITKTKVDLINLDSLNFLNSNKSFLATTLVRKTTKCTIAAVAEDYAINWDLPTYHSNSLNSNRPTTTLPKQKITQSTIEAAEDYVNWDSFDYMTLDRAIEHHKNHSRDKETLYKCFDTYANMDNPRAKYWKAYYISKGWSDNVPNDKIIVQLYKAAADYGDEMPDAQLRYATMVMQGKGVERNKEEAIKYFLKAAKNGHVVAMFNIATYYYSKKENELGNYYMISAASKGYEQSINYCKRKNISY
ncbi:hypothetical protein RclHR1_00400007 [Rhizophagus clarus]|uniref:Kinase-like domain-containing protein n=1 Tax=Rhizophagus clarus TaxID=94130 RepID=A0A2Z6RID1_9GLOM|nr:hypothetical protein RclHR1_00400007 [Rhizophagus clarus]GES84025.1 kinase-like domain-containing protein [Rhizophagus clarus]